MPKAMEDFELFLCSKQCRTLFNTSGRNAGEGDNGAIALMTVIGPRDNLHDFININEVSTVASVYTLTAFINPTDTTAIGAPPANSEGLVNAMAEVNNLVNTSEGEAFALTPAGNGTVPEEEVNTLANLLVTCVDTSQPSSPRCISLFTTIPS
jgi:hypothetical protein